jgi:hypothetical protein
MAEFAPALFIFLILILFPFINLFGYLCGVATAQLIANQCATAAAVSQTYPDALTATTDTAVQLTNSILGQFGRLQPVGGYKGTGVDVYVAVTNIGSNITTIVGPNQPVPGPIDTTNNIYEYEAQVTYNVGPFISMAGLPIVGQLPMLGKPAQFIFAVQKAAEYPDGLVGNGIQQNGGSVGPPGGGMPAGPNPGSGTGQPATAVQIQ